MVLQKAHAQAQTAQMLSTSPEADLISGSSFLCESTFLLSGVLQRSQQLPGPNENDKPNPQ